MLLAFGVPLFWTCDWNDHDIMQALVVGWMICWSNYTLTFTSIEVLRYSE